MLPPTLLSLPQRRDLDMVEGWSQAGDPPHPSSMGQPWVPTDTPIFRGAQSPPAVAAVQWALRIHRGGAFQRVEFSQQLKDPREASSRERKSLQVASGRAAEGLQLWALHPQTQRRAATEGPTHCPVLGWELKVSRAKGFSPADTARHAAHLVDLGEGRPRAPHLHAPPAGLLEQPPGGPLPAGAQDPARGLLSLQRAPGRLVATQLRPPLPVAVGCAGLSRVARTFRGPGAGRDPLGDVLVVRGGPPLVRAAVIQKQWTRTAE